MIDKNKVTLSKYTPILGSLLRRAHMRRFLIMSCLHSSYWVAGCVVGVSAVLYAKLIDVVQHFYFQFFQSYPYFLSLASPLLYLGATALVVKLAPHASGSGIPQVLQAIEFSKQEQPHRYEELVSIRTAFVKVLSTTLGILGGASLGREGPTVQISAAVFALTGKKLKKFFPKINFHSYLIAGAGAGVAAAFNTPLAGIVFALEEIAHGSAFAAFKEWVILGVVIAGITAQGLVGNFLYFGHPTFQLPSLMLMIPEAFLIGIITGLTGGLFARFLADSSQTRWLPKNWWIRSIICGVICSILIFLSNGDSAGSGYEVTRHFMDNKIDPQMPLFFPITKFFVTVFSYLSGMAGGIFSPCLSIGSGIGYTIATVLGFSSLKFCALVGMVGFFSGVVQAPLTAVIIVMEMTDEHSLVLPFLVTAYLSQAISRIVMSTPLYSSIAFKNHSDKNTFK